MPVNDTQKSTILGGIVGSDKAVPWTKPDDLEVDPSDLIGSLGNIGENVDLLMALGVARLSAELPSTVFHALATANGQELIDCSTLHRFTAHSGGTPLWSEDQARSQEAYHLSVIVSVLMEKYGREKTFPGGDQLSWRVHVLPALDHRDLYRQFRLDEPWDSPHNKQLIPYMPDIFRDSNAPSDSTTTRIVALSGEGAICQKGGESLHYDAVTDDLQKTILLMQAPPGKEVVWSKPDDFPFDSDSPMSGLENVSRVHGLLIGLMSRQVGYLSLRIKPEEFQALVTPNGGEVVDPSSFLIQ